MKLKSIEERKDGMWCRLASGGIFTYWSPDKEWIRRDDGYLQALIDMGAEWYPPIPEGYRLATEEDRMGFIPDGTNVAVVSKWVPNDWCVKRGWQEGWEYIVPVKQEPKVYEVVQLLPGQRYVRVLDDFQPGDLVEVRKVER